MIFAAIVLGIQEYNKLSEQKRALAAEPERLRREEIARTNARIALQESYYRQIVSVSVDSLNLFEAMPAHLLSAEELLDEAERDFREGVFAPFWDSIEKTMVRLGNFYDSVQKITMNSKTHTGLVKMYEADSPRFPIAMESVRAMATANTTADRVRAIVRKAQSNPHFAMIYEQRRTNQHLENLVAGFSNLAQALDGMGQRISSSIDGLGNQISEMSSTLDSSLTAIRERLQTANQELSKGVDIQKKEAADQAVRYERALSMLNNIQKRRKPHGEGDY